MAASELFSVPLKPNSNSLVTNELSTEVAEGVAPTTAHDQQNVGDWIETIVDDQIGD
jgi:hypothetical protein